MLTLSHRNTARRKFGRALFLTALLLGGISTSFAAPNCPAPPYAPRSTDKIMTWYDAFLRPFKAASGIQDSASLTMDQIQAELDRLVTYHRNVLRDSLFFEALVQQIAAEYARSPNFMGLDTQRARKIYQRGSGADLDFSIMCIDTRAGKAPDDTFAVTLFAVTRNECQRVGLRGLVFSETLVNGAVNGECRPDQVYFNRIYPLMAGTNAVTFLCRKDNNGCLRH